MQTNMYKLSDAKIRQEIYHRLTPVIDDDLKTKNVVMVTELSEVLHYAVEYFKTRDIGWQIQI